MASFNGYKRSITLNFDYKEIQEGVPNVRKQMAILNQEFKTSSKEAEISGKEIDKLGTKHDYLSNKLKIQQKDVDAYRQKLNEATNAKGNNTKAIENNTASLQIAEARLAQTKAELAQVSAELDKQRTTLGKTSDEWKELGENTTALGKDLSMKLTAPIMAAAIASFKLGADYEQALGKMEVVFENNAKSIEKWASTALKDFGLARSTAVTMASDFGALFKGMGFAAQKTEEWSKTLTERTMDLSNFYDTTVAETTTALNAIVTGQTEPLRKFGINMSQAALQEYAYANGIRKKIADMKEAEKVQLRYMYVIDKTNIAVGTTARESDSATGQMNKFNQVVKELGVSFSEQLMPIFTPIIEGVNNLIEKFAGLSEGTKKFIVVGGMLVATVGPMLIFIGSIFTAISSITTGIGAMSKAVSSFSNVLDTGAFVSFAKWAAIIVAVVLAITALIFAINYLIGKGKDMNDFASSMENMTSNVGASMNKTYSTGTAYGARWADGSHADGLDYVPRDGYRAILHKGERVITAEENKRQSTGDTYILQVNMDEVDEVYKLTNVFNQFKQTRRAGLVNG